MLQTAAHVTSTNLNVDGATVLRQGAHLLVQIQTKTFIKFTSGVGQPKGTCGLQFSKNSLILAESTTRLVAAL